MMQGFRDFENYGYSYPEKVLFLDIDGVLGGFIQEIGKKHTKWIIGNLKYMM